MTLDGTNTWVLREPGGGRSVVVDPGPPDPAHLDAVRAVAGDVAVVLLTHHHLDHSEAAREFAESVGCGVRALDPAYRLGTEGLGEGDVVAVDGLEVHVVATPGHTADSLSFLLPAEQVVLTGDTVLGRGTTVVAHPDGRLGAYLDSLDRLHALAEARELTAIWPGHGPVLPDALPVLDHYVAHRRERLDQVAAAVRRLRAGGVADALTLPRQVVEIVYADVDPVLWGAAELSVRAQLASLRTTTEVELGVSPRDSRFGPRFRGPLCVHSDRWRSDLHRQHRVPVSTRMEVGQEPGMLRPTFPTIPFLGREAARLGLTAQGTPLRRRPGSGPSALHGRLRPRRRPGHDRAQGRPRPGWW